MTAEVLEIIAELAQMGVLGWIANKLRKQKEPELKDLLRRSLIDRIERGEALSGRDRLRARILAREAARRAKEEQP